MAFQDIIKYEGGNDLLVWKHPREDFNIASTLIVHESQEAILIKGGVLKQLYEKGSYKIHTENLPFLTAIKSTLLTGGETPHHYEVYFFNKATIMHGFWGTSEPMTIQDPVSDVPFDVTARGEFAVKIADSCKLFKELVGTEERLDIDKLEEKFSALLKVRIKDYISKVMVEGKISFLEINSQLQGISETLKSNLSGVLATYGLHLAEFAAESISIVKDDKYDQFCQAFVERGRQKIEGFDYVTKRALDVAEKQAGNTSASGTVMSAGVGLGAGYVGGQMMGSLMQQAVNRPLTQNLGSSSIRPDDEFGRVSSRRRRAEKRISETEETGVTTDKDQPQEASATAGQMIEGFAPASAHNTSVQSQTIHSMPPFHNNVPAYKRKKQPCCPGCGETVKTGWKCCPFCGKPLNECKQ